MKKIVCVILILIFAGSSLFAQNLAERKSVNVKDVGFNNNKIISDDLAALFAATVVFGEAPLIVQFKDMSTGDPQSWSWYFGDGNVSILQHPLHTYENPGLYTVKLTVSDSANTSTFTREDYIMVVEPGIWDTIAWPLIGEKTYYIVINGESGYVSGNNSFGDLAKASYFSGLTNGSQITAGIFDFAIAERTMTNDIPIKFNIWDNNGPYSTPGDILGTSEKKISEIVYDVQTQSPTIIFFNPPVQFDGSFYLGVELPQIVGDTLALFTNTNGDVIAGNAWEQHSSENWYPYSDETFSWGMDLDHAIFPIADQGTGINDPDLVENILIFPNPVASELNIFFPDCLFHDVEIQIYDLTGKLLIFRNEKNISNSRIKLDVGKLHNGIYTIRIIADKNIFSRKITVIK